MISSLNWAVPFKEFVSIILVVKFINIKLFITLLHYSFYISKAMFPLFFFFCFVFVIILIKPTASLVIFFHFYKEQAFDFIKVLCCFLSSILLIYIFIFISFFFSQMVNLKLFLFSNISIYCCFCTHCFSFIPQFLIYLFSFTFISKIFVNALVMFALIHGLFLNAWKIFSIFFVSLFCFCFWNIFLLI